ncbi:target of Nesh-SH3 isoform X12 [Melanerpes formicivorus]|uniref:target of Nesh-SH3 isoform X12 n=1 Tax=Melanerpes formicivorus TaxID=211600 RepID=UPI00358EED82
MMPRLVLLLFCGYIALSLGNAQKLPRVKRQSLKVQINATDDTVCMRYLRPSQNTRLEGFILGYGSSFLSNQYIPLPSDGKTSVTELDAEPRYLVSVRPARASNNKKSCSGRTKTQKPLQLVVGTLTPTSVFLSWGILVNPKHDWTTTNNCASDRFYTVRYREKGKDKKWVFQLCPVTETVVDNLKPNTVYEFGVKDNVEDSIWSKTFSHKIDLSGKKGNGHFLNMYKLVPNSQTQLTLRDNKKLVPVTIIKQVIQNRTQPKTADSSSLPGAILVHLIVPGLNETQQKLPPLLTIDDIPQASRKKLAKNETQVWPAESKTPEVQEISPQSLPTQDQKKYGPEEFKSTPRPELVQTQSILATNEIQPPPSGPRILDAPKSPLTELATQSPTLKSTSLPSSETREMEMEETQLVDSGSKTPGTTEGQPTRSASHDFLHVTSTPQTFTASEKPDTAGDTTELEISRPIITTEPQLLETAMDLGERKPLPSGPTVSSMPEMPPISAATQRLHPEPTSAASVETKRPVKATRRPRRKSTTAPPLTTQQTVMASHDFLHVTSTPQTSTSTVMPEQETATQRLHPEPTSAASVETKRPVKATRRPRRKSTTAPPLTTQQTVMASHDFLHVTSTPQTSTSTVMPEQETATQRLHPEPTSAASVETKRPVKATRRPRRKSTTAPPLTTQQTVMASHDFLHVTSTPQTSTSTVMPEQETATQRLHPEPTSAASVETKRPVKATRRPRRKSTTAPPLTTQQTVMASHDFLHVTSTPQTSTSAVMPEQETATKRLHPEPTSAASVETKRPVKATRRPRRKSTTAPPLTTQQTVMASVDSHHVTFPFQTSASAEISKPEAVTSSADLEKSMLPLSRTPHGLTTTLVYSGIQPVLPSPVTPSKPETADAEPATSESSLETLIPKTSHPFQWPRVTLAPKEIPLIPSKPKPSVAPEVQHAKPAPKPPLLEPKTTQTVEQPHATLAPKEATLTPPAPKPRPSKRPKKPQKKPATTPASVTTRSLYIYELPKSAEVLEPITLRIEPPRSTIAPKETQRVPSKPKTPPKPHSPQAKDVMDSITHRSDRVKPTIVPKETQRAPFKPRTSPSSEVPQTKPFLEPITFGTEKPKSTVAPKDARHKPPKSKTSPSPYVPPTRATPKESQRVTPKPRASPSPDVPHTKPAPKETLLPSKPKTSVGPEVLQTKTAPNETYHISPKPKTALATEIPRFSSAPHKTRLTSARPRPSDKPQTRPVLGETTVAPARTKAPGRPKWIVPSPEGVYTPEDITRQLGVDVKKPLEYVDTWEKPISVTTSPGPRHPPIPPVKPTQMRRKPLPPNTVTGKPGSPAKPAGPTTPVRTGTSYKIPTAFATPEDYVDTTVFSSSPTSETDSSGKPRYQAPHVKYMKKDDDVPCSITSSLEHFPQEEASSKEEPTRPPQNPPTNLTVVTVEGCPTFVILDWEKPDNDTVTEYEVVSTENGGSDGEKEQSIITTNQTHSTVENLKPDTSYEFHVKPKNPLGEGPSSSVVAFSTESADPRVSEPISVGKDAIWTEIKFNSDTYSECKGKQYVKRTWYKKFVGVQLCNSLRYKIYLSDSLTGKFYDIGDQRGHGEDHCQFVDSFLDGRTGQQEDLPVKDGFFRAVRQEPVKFGKIGGETQINYVRWYECGTSIPGKW